MLNYKIEKNAQIVRVCTKLYNYCIHMAQQDGGGKIAVIEGDNFDLIEYGIKPMLGEGNQSSSNRYLETLAQDDTTVPLPMDVLSTSPLSRRRRLRR